MNWPALICVCFGTASVGSAAQCMLLWDSKEVLLCIHAVGLSKQVHVSSQRKIMHCGVYSLRNPIKYIICL